MITRSMAWPLFLKGLSPPGIAARGGSLITEIFNFAHAAAGLFERPRDVSSKNMTSTLSQRTAKTKVQSPKDKKIVSIRDPYQGKSSLWTVDVSTHCDWKDPDQIHCILVSLRRDSAAQRPSSQSPEHLLRLMAEAWAETWTGGAETPHPLSEDERSLLDTLIRDLHAAPETRLVGVSLLMTADVTLDD